MYTINNVFDMVYLVNLKREPQKFNTMKKKLDNLDIKFQHFEAIDGSKIQDCKLLRFGNKGAVGYKMSMMSIIHDAKNNNYSKILILEDDLYFSDDFNNNFNDCYTKTMKLNENWKLLYLGASNRTGKNHINYNILNKNKENLHQIGKKVIAGSYGICYSSSIFDEVLKCEFDNKPFDDILSDVVCDSNYICIPYLLYANVNKPSTTVDNNNKNQEFYNKLNYIDPTKYS
uniref:Glycosyl transferase family 25 domain-containing protein n=1 Tax=viral metagenome TaxID=1070528 RepID=A0A6C0CP28_9ZZZZ